MGLWSAIKSVASGNFSDAGNYLFTSEEDIATQAQVNNAQAAILEEQQARGVISEDEANAMFSEIQRNAYPYIWNETGGGPGGAFTSELKEQITNLPKNLSDASRKTVAEALWLGFRALPWYVWAILAIAGLIYVWPFIAPFIPRRGKR